MAKQRLLVADPNPVLLEIYETYLISIGFEVATAGDCEECLELLCEFLPDALIVNLELTDDGADTDMAIFWKDAEVRSIPAVLIVNHTSNSESVRLRLPAVVKLLDKETFHLPDLKAAVELALRERL